MSYLQKMNIMQGNKRIENALAKNNAIKIKIMNPK